MRTLPRSFKPELIVSALLLLSVLITWMSFVFFLDQSAGERAAFWFMRNHLRLGEPTSFVLRIAGQGIPQPAEILVTWREFQLSVLFALLFIVALAWLTYRLWRAETQRSV